MGKQELAEQAACSSSRRLQEFPTGWFKAGQLHALKLNVFSASKLKGVDLCKDL